MHPGLRDRLLHPGTMGVVYQAVRTGGLGRPVAIKVLPSSAGFGESPALAGAGCARHAAVSAVRHPNVVTLYDHGEAGGWFYLVLEYVPVGTLKERLALNGPLPPNAAAGLVETVAHAVGCCHARGLLHLDLKPSNILLDAAERDTPWDRVVPKVSDFGLCSQIATIPVCQSRACPASGEHRHTWCPSKPPRRDRIGAVTDVYALGAILYELLTGLAAVPGLFDAGDARPGAPPRARGPAASEPEDPP